MDNAYRVWYLSVVHTRKGTMTTDTSILTTGEVAAMFRVSPATVRRWVHDGWIRGIRIGPREFRFEREDVDAFRQRGEK